MLMDVFWYKLLKNTSTNLKKKQCVPLIPSRLFPR